MTATHLHLYRRVEGITRNWDDCGGIIIITSDNPDDVWREHAADHYGDTLNPDALNDITADLVLALADNTIDTQVIIFPDGER